MRPFWALIRKQLHESRWTLGVSAAVLFGLGWLSVYVTSLNETRITRMLGSGGGGAPLAMEIVGRRARARRRARHLPPSTLPG